MARDRAGLLAKLRFKYLKIAHPAAISSSVQPNSNQVLLARFVVLYCAQLSRGCAMSRLYIGPTVLFLFAGCMLFPPRSDAWQLNGGRPDDNNLTINGNVYYDEGDQPASHVMVQLQGSEGESRQQEETTDSGWFEFRRLGGGTYVLMVDVQGYERVATTVDLSFMPEKGVVIRLRSLSGEKKTATGTGSVSAHELSMPEKARELMSAGMKKLYTDKNAQGALEDFQSAIAAAQGYYEACYQGGMAYLSLGRLDDAEVSFRKSIELSGDKYSEADVGLGTLMLDRRDFAQGEKTVRRGVELNPDYWLGQYELGRALLNLDNVPEALKSADRAKLLAPSAAVVYRLLSNIHLRQKDYPALLADIDSYIKLDPDSAAGIRAKQLREQVAQKVDTAKATPAAQKTP
jgi:tetratricopeptide (TPR) repeat protein